MATVYWIKHPTHTNITLEGYVGFTTKTILTRYKKHVADANGKEFRNYTLHNAIRKYGEVVLEIVALAEGDDVYCLDLENKLRPKVNIGWNQAIGGSRPPSHKNRIWTAEQKAKISAAQKGRVRTPETLLKLSANRLGKKTSAETKLKLSLMKLGKPPWQHSQAILPIWVNAEYLFIKFSNTPNISRREVDKLLNLGCAQSIFKKIKSGWIPSEDIIYQTWLKDYKGTI